MRQLNDIDRDSVQEKTDKIPISHLVFTRFTSLVLFSVWLFVLANSPNLIAYVRAVSDKFSKIKEDNNALCFDKNQKLTKCQPSTPVTGFRIRDLR